MTTYYKVGAAPSRVEWDPNTEARLAREARRSPEARAKFLEMFLLYAADIGQRAAAGRLRQDDCISAANRGLSKALDRWVPDGRSRFSTFARKIIKGAVLSEVRRQRIYSARTISTQDPNHSEEVELAEPTGHEPDAFSDLARVVNMEFLNRVMEAVLTPRERRLFRLRFKNGWTFERIALKEGVRRQRVEQIVSAAMIRLREAFGPKFKRKR